MLISNSERQQKFSVSSIFYIDLYRKYLVFCLAFIATLPGKSALHCLRLELGETVTSYLSTSTCQHLLVNIFEDRCSQVSSDSTSALILEMLVVESGM